MTPAKLRSLAILITLLVSGSISTLAHAGQQIEWKSLLPKVAPLKDPLNRLTQDQRFDFQTVIWARTLSDEEKNLDYNRQPVEDAAGYEKQFQKSGINVDKLLVRYQKYEKELARRKKLLNPAMNGRKIRLAGYILPTAFSESGSKDFLLVPYVGACVHTPPPPKNQIVFVRLAKKFQVKDLFTPVWVTGPIKAKSTRKSIELSDGNRNIDIGYRVDGAKIEVYKDR